MSLRSILLEEHYISEGRSMSMSELKRFTEVRKKESEPKDSRFTSPKKPKPKRESGTRLRGH